eukprot:TRINITY_DN1980_c0_g3_i2.p1 TRINITY_DN1980_c0_g3~~TRINITY_DN1980_c0_g3_i2.p1  ORF type:complete len:350 (+),score=39.36 TRINITY_DN1980_c0_g3_i2:71-1120(+)
MKKFKSSASLFLLLFIAQCLASIEYSSFNGTLSRDKPSTNIPLSVPFPYVQMLHKFTVSATNPTSFRLSVRVDSSSSKSYDVTVVDSKSPYISETNVFRPCDLAQDGHLNQLTLNFGSNLDSISSSSSVEYLTNVGFIDARLLIGENILSWEYPPFGTVSERVLVYVLSNMGNSEGQAYTLSLSFSSVRDIESVSISNNLVGNCFPDHANYTWTRLMDSQGENGILKVMNLGYATWFISIKRKSVPLSDSSSISLSAQFTPDYVGRCSKGWCVRQDTPTSFVPSPGTVPTSAPSSSNPTHRTYMPTPYIPWKRSVNGWLIFVILVVILVVIVLIGFFVWKKRRRYVELA